MSSVMVAILRLVMGFIREHRNYFAKFATRRLMPAPRHCCRFMQYRIQSACGGGVFFAVI